MHTIIYKFKAKTGCEKDFVESWKKVTENIYQERGSLGSRLHHSSSGEILAYAQWPSKKQAQLKIDTSQKYKEDLEQMLNHLEESEVLFELDVTEDLLKTETH